MVHLGLKIRMSKESYKGNGGKILGRGKHQEGNLPGIQLIASSFYCVIDPSDLTLSLPECLRGFSKVTLTYG